MIIIKKINYLFLVFLFFIFINLFQIDNIKLIIIDSTNFWFQNLIPAIFPFYIVSDLLINYGITLILNRLVTIKKLFKLSSSGLFLIIFSMITGLPSGAIYISKLLKEDLISVEEANRIICFCHFSNPLFIINTIGLNILGNKTLGFFILLSHYLSNFIIAFVFKNNCDYDSKIFIHNQVKFGKVLSTSIINTFNSLLIILGNIISFQLLLTIIFNYVDISDEINAFISLFLEISNGLTRLKLLNIDIILKSAIITSAISFGGLCIHSQVYTILSDTKIKYKNYLFGRIVQAILAPLIFLIICFFHGV